MKKPILVLVLPLAVVALSILLYIRYWDNETDDFVCGITEVEHHGLTYGTVLSNGRCWLDRNLGASRVATSSTDEEAYGDLYQWGRATDGHEKRNSDTTWGADFTLSSSDTPGHGNFIVAPYSPWDWRNPRNDNLWQGVNGINNPCPPGWRLPTADEWDAERNSWSSNNSAGAFASPLKLPMSGLRKNIGPIDPLGPGGYYWSSTVDDNYSWYLGFFRNDDSFMMSYFRSLGLSVRCIRD